MDADETELHEAQGNEPPFTVFTIQMDNLEDSSIRLKIWRDKKFKHEKRVTLMNTNSLNLFKNSLLRKADSFKEEAMGE